MLMLLLLLVSPSDVKVHAGALDGRRLERALCSSGATRFEFARLHWCLLSARTPGTGAGVAAEEHLFEGLPEDLVEYGVEYGVHHGTGIAQPGDHVEDPMTDPLLALRTHRGQQVEYKERRPEYHEREEHHAQHLGRLLFQPNDASVSR